MPVSAISTYILSGNVISINDISIIKEGFWREVQGSDAAEYLSSAHFFSFISWLFREEKVVFGDNRRTIAFLYQMEE